jgi:hypothetical protein
MKYQKSNTIIGAWIKGSELSAIKEAKIVSETEPKPSLFTNKEGSPKTQNVCKIMFKGKEEVFNISLNKATINGLVDAFGDESKDWMNKLLGVETEKVRVAGKAGIATYLIPEGYERVDNQDGFAEIVKMGLEKKINQPEDIPVINDENDNIDVADIPF